MRFYQILLAEAANYDQLLSQFGDKLKIRFGQDNSIDNDTAPASFMTWLDKNINPTSKHEVLQWIIKTYVDGGIRLSEDLARTKVALETYFKYKNAMPMSLNSIKKLNDLESMVEKYGKQSKKSAADSDTRGYAKETTEVIYNGPEGKILWPRTKGASCVYGAGTKWCISATKSKNYFNDYSFTHNKHFLFILPVDNTKWALVYDQKTGNIEEAFNENDDSIEPDVVFRKYPWVKRLLDKSKIFHIARDTTTTDISKMKPQDLVAAIRNESLKPNDLIDTELSKYQQLALIEYNIKYLTNIKNPHIEVQLAAVKRDGHAIQYIKDPASEQVQIAAVKQNGYAIDYIKNPAEQVQIAAVKQNGYAIEYINNPASEQVQIAAVKQNGYAIDYIKTPSEQIQLAAVNQDGYAIQYIKKPLEQIQLAAVKQNGYAIDYIKKPALEQIQLAAVNQDGRAIQLIKDPSKQLQLAAVNQDGLAIEYINKPPLEVQIAAVMKNGLAIEYINNPSDQIQLAAVKQRSYAIEYINNPSEQIQLAAVKQNGYAIDYINNPSEQVQIAAQHRYR